MNRKPELEVLGTFRAAGVPEKYVACRLENFEARPEFPSVVPFLKKYIAEEVNLDGRRGSPERMGLFLTGPVGTGKTHLAVGAEAEFESAGLRTHFSAATGFLLACERSREFDAELPEDGDLERMSRMLDRKSYRPTSVYVLDDLGVERQTPFAVQMVNMLIESMYSENRRLIVTSNLDLCALNKLSPRVADRVAEVCHIVRLSSESYRVLKTRRRVSENVIEDKGL